MKRFIIAAGCLMSSVSWGSSQKFECYSTPYIMDLEVSDTGEARLALNWPNNFGYVYSVRSEARREDIGANETVAYTGYFTKSYPSGEGAKAFDLIAKKDEKSGQIVGWSAVTYFKYVYFGPIEKFACNLK